MNVCRRNKVVRAKSDRKNRVIIKYLINFVGVSMETDVRPVTWLARFSKKKKKKIIWCYKMSWLCLCTLFFSIPTKKINILIFRNGPLWWQALYAIIWWHRGSPGCLLRLWVRTVMSGSKASKRLCWCMLVSCTYLDELNTFRVAK